MLETLRPFLSECQSAEGTVNSEVWLILAMRDKFRWKLNLEMTKLFSPLTEYFEKKEEEEHFHFILKENSFS